MNFDIHSITIANDEENIEITNKKRIANV